MDAKYYMEVRPQINDNHAVHMEDCPFLKGNEKRIYLGEFDTVMDALIEGRRYFARTNACLFCSEIHKREGEEPSQFIRAKKSVESLVPSAYNQSLFCCLN